MGSVRVAKTVYGLLKRFTGLSKGAIKTRLSFKRKMDGPSAYSSQVL